jgi:hypothetical protein
LFAKNTASRIDLADGQPGPSVADLPSLAANPVSGAWNPILMLSAAIAGTLSPIMRKHTTAQTALFAFMLPPSFNPILC